MEHLLRSHPNTSASHKYLVEAHRSLLNVALLHDVTDLSCRYGLSLRYHPSPVPIPIECLWITTYGRFGNLIMQLGHALDVAKRLGVAKIYFERRVQQPGVFHETGPCKVDGIELFADSYAQPSPHEVVLYGSFWSLHDFLPSDKPLQPRDVVPSQHLLAVLSDHVRDEPSGLPEDDVVAHFRGGDVFQANVPATHYGQPPVAFYIKATDLALNGKGGTVHVVYEDMTNPAVQPFIDWLISQDVPHKLQSGELKDDLRVMLGARAIVSSFGTFVPAVMKLSPHIRDVYAFDNHEVHNAWTRFRRDVTVHAFTDGTGTYFKRGEWLVSEPQLEMMRRFRVEDVIPSPDASGCS